MSKYSHTLNTCSSQSTQTELVTWQYLFVDYAENRGHLPALLCFSLDPLLFVHTSTIEVPVEGSISILAQRFHPEAVWIQSLMVGGAEGHDMFQIMCKTAFETSLSSRCRHPILHGYESLADMRHFQYLSECVHKLRHLKVFLSCVKCS